MEADKQRDDSHIVNPSHFAFCGTTKEEQKREMRCKKGKRNLSTYDKREEFLRGKEG